MRARDITCLIERDGWLLVTTRGSHRQYEHATTPGRVTIVGKPSDEIRSGTLASVLKQAGLEKDG